MGVFLDEKKYTQISRITNSKILTNEKRSFMHTQSFANEESDFHHMIYTMFKTTYIKLPPKIVKYRCFKTFIVDEFQRDLESNLLYMNTNMCIGDYNFFERTFQQTLDKHAPVKTKIVRGNNKLFINKDLRKAMATRSRLFNIACKSNNPNDMLKYKKQRNFVTK